MKLVVWNIAIRMENNEQVLKFIKKQNADFVCLQEALFGIEKTAKPELATANYILESRKYKNFHFAPIWEARGIHKNNQPPHVDFGGLVQQGCLLLSKHKIISGANQFYYNEYRFDFDSTEFRQKDWCRSIQNCVVEIDGNKIQIINVHGLWNIDKLGDERTIAQSKFIIKNMCKDMSVIVCGDFNLLPESKSIKMLEEHLENQNIKFGIKCTRPRAISLNVDANNGNTIVDYVFTKGINVKKLRAVANNISDHYPLILEF